MLYQLQPLHQLQTQHFVPATEEWGQTDGVFSAMSRALRILGKRSEHKVPTILGKGQLSFVGRLGLQQEIISLQTFWKLCRVVGDAWFGLRSVYDSARLS